MKLVYDLPVVSSAAVVLLTLRLRRLMYAVLDVSVILLCHYFSFDLIYLILNTVTNVTRGSDFCVAQMALLPFLNNASK